MIDFVLLESNPLSLRNAYCAWIGRERPYGIETDNETGFIVLPVIEKTYKPGVTKSSLHG